MTQPTTVRWLIRLGAATILAFLAVSLISHRHAAVIDSLAESIGTHGIASVDELNASRGDLHRVGLAVREALHEVAAGAPLQRSRIDVERSRLEAHLSAYESTLAYPGEEPLAWEVKEAAADFLREGERVLDHLKAGELRAAETIFSEGFIPASEHTDKAIERLIDFNAAGANDTGQRIQAERASTARLSYLLQGITAALALLGFTLVAFMSRNNERIEAEERRLNDERQQWMERRTVELEAFAGRVAHDLKTPLSAALLGLHLAQSKSPQRSLARAEGAVRRAVTMTDGLLEFARSGAAPISGARSNLGEALHSAVSDLARAAADADARISVEGSSDVEVACPAGPLHCVIGNLLGNAVKYINDGGPVRRIDVRVSPSPGRDRVRVEIRDTGPGIPDDLQPEIFLPYFRGLSTKQPGVGLGLATVKRIVDAYGGTIGVRSAEGAGSCFWFELPIAKPEATGESLLH